MINIFKKTKKINEPEINEPEFSDFEKIVLKMCNGEAPLYNIDKKRVFFKYEKHIYGIWFGNGVDGITLYEIDGDYLTHCFQQALPIHKELRIKLWNQYGELYQKFEDNLSFKEAKEVEEKYSIKIIKK